MNSEYSNNPLTEVALALSMAFFSIMVLTIFALSQKSKIISSNEKISVSSISSDKKKQNKNRRRDPKPRKRFLVISPKCRLRNSVRPPM